MKKQKKTPMTRLNDNAGAGPFDWTPLFLAFGEATEWTLDVAIGLAGDHPEELDALERVREFVRARIAGKTAKLSADDVLLTFSSVQRVLWSIGVAPSRS